MRRALGYAIFAAFALAMAGCGSVQTGVRNDLAANCATPQAMQNFVNNLPPSLLTGQQQLAIQEQLCHAMFGDVAAPVTAPGNQPAVPGAPTPAPSPVASK